MITAVPGRAGHRLGSAVACLFAVLALVLMAALPEALAASSKAAPAAQVPLPSLRPAAASDPAAVVAADDPIAAIISQTPDESRAAEDSDAPQAGDSATVDAPPIPAPAATVPAALNSAGLKLALKLLDNGDPAAATVAAYALPDPVDIKIVDWLVATSGSNAVPSSRILAVRGKLRDWPGQTLLRIRYEQAIAREKPAPADVIKALGSSKPVTDFGHHRAGGSLCRQRPAEGRGRAHPQLLAQRELLAVGRKDHPLRVR